MSKLYDKYPLLRGKDTDPRSRRYITPTRIVWTSASEGADVRTPESLLNARTEQITLGGGDDPEYQVNCTMINTPGKPKASILLDYGMELNGTVRLMVWNAEGGKNGHDQTGKDHRRKPHQKRSDRKVSFHLHHRFIYMQQRFKI